MLETKRMVLEELVSMMDLFMRDSMLVECLMDMGGSYMMEVIIKDF